MEHIDKKEKALLNEILYADMVMQLEEKNAVLLEACEYALEVLEDRGLEPQVIDTLQQAIKKAK